MRVKLTGIPWLLALLALAALLVAGGAGGKWI